MATAKSGRPAPLQAEWEGLGDPSADGFFDRLGRASVETVIAARRVHCAVALRDRIDEILVPLLRPRLQAAARRMARGYPAFYAEEIEGELIEGFWRAVLAGESFFEIRFNYTLHQLAVSAWRKVLDAEQRKRERLAARFGTDDGQAVEDRLPVEEDGFDQVELRVIISTLIDQLPLEVGLALTLHYLMDLKIFSQDKKERTVATELRCSERKARELIAEGLTLLREMAGVLSVEAHDG